MLISEIKNDRLTWSFRKRLQNEIHNYVKKNFNNNEVSQIFQTLKDLIVQELIVKYPKNKMDTINHFLPMWDNCKKRIYLFPSLFNIYPYRRSSDSEQRIITLNDILFTSSGFLFGNVVARDGVTCTKPDLNIGEINLPYMMCGVLSDSAIIWRDYIILATEGREWSEKTAKSLNSLFDAIVEKTQKNHNILNDYNILINQAKSLKEILSFLPESMIQYLVDFQILTLKNKKVKMKDYNQNSLENIPKDVLDRLSSFC